VRAPNRRALKSRIPTGVSSAFRALAALCLTLVAGVTGVSHANQLANRADRPIAALASLGTLEPQTENQITATTQTSDAAIAYQTGSSSQKAVYNTLNEQTSLGAPLQTFDADGNLTADATRAYAWDGENRLATVTVSKTGQANFTYDGLGRRIAATPTSSTPAPVGPGICSRAGSRAWPWTMRI